jgi:hypothetical protein
MGCNDQIKHRCKKVYGKCVAYELEVPEFSSLNNQDCLNIEEVAEDIYNIIGAVKEEIDLSDLENQCLTLPGTPTVKNVVQLLIDTICTQQTTIEALQETVGTMQEEITQLQEQNCP